MDPDRLRIDFGTPLPIQIESMLEVSWDVPVCRYLYRLAEFGHTLKIVFGGSFPKLILDRFASISQFRTHKIPPNGTEFRDESKGPVPGSETRISRKKVRLIFLN